MNRSVRKKHVAMDSDIILPSPNGILPAEIMTQIVRDYFAFRNAEVNACCDDELKRRFKFYNETSALVWRPVPREFRIRFDYVIWYE
jgi:hypothetical protein